MIKDSTINIVIKAKDKASAVFDNFNKKNKETIKNLKKISIAGGAMAVAIGTKAVIAAADFDAQMSNVSTLLDTSVENMDDMKKAVLDLSKKTPVALSDLTASLYDVRSAGIEASGAMSVLESSSRLAVGGLGTTSEATDILTSAINAFGLDAKKSDEWANVFFKSVKAGKTTVAGLAQGFGQIAPLANEVGIQFEELMGITSAMTTSGLDASVAYTQVRATVSNLLKPTKDMQEIYGKLNITNIKTEIQQKGLTNVIRELTNATGGNNEMLAKAFGSVEALNAVMMLNSETGDKAIEITAGMTNGIDELTTAFDKQNETASAQYKILKNQLNTEMIKLGTVILPKLLTGIENSRLILGEWKEWFMSVADAIGTVIFKATQAWDWLKKIDNKIKESPIGKATGFLTGSSKGESNIKGVPFFDNGGVVPGQVGSPQLAVVHGGETILPTHKNDAIGNTVIFDLRGATLTDKDLINRIKANLNQSFNIAKFAN